MLFLPSLNLFSFHKDTPGWDGGRSNGFVNAYHDNRSNDNGGRGAYRGNRGGGQFNPLQNAGGKPVVP